MHPYSIFQIHYIYVDGFDLSNFVWMEFCIILLYFICCAFLSLFLFPDFIILSWFFLLNSLVDICLYCLAFFSKAFYIGIFRMVYVIWWVCILEHVVSHQSPCNLFYCELVILQTYMWGYVFGFNENSGNLNLIWCYGMEFRVKTHIEYYIVLDSFKSKWLPVDMQCDPILDLKVF